MAKSKNNSSRDTTKRVFHGVLLSELDDQDQVVEAFIDAEDTFADLQYRYQHGELAADEYAVALQKFHVTHEGERWTIGATSGNWYVKRNGMWEPRPAPRVGGGSSPADDEAPYMLSGDLLGDYFDGNQLTAEELAAVGPIDDPVETAPVPAPEAPPVAAGTEIPVTVVPHQGPIEVPTHAGDAPAAEMPSEAASSDDPIGDYINSALPVWETGEQHGGAHVAGGGNVGAHTGEIAALMPAASTQDAPPVRSAEPEDDGLFSDLGL